MKTRIRILCMVLATLMVITSLAGCSADGKADMGFDNMLGGPGSNISGAEGAPETGEEKGDADSDKPYENIVVENPFISTEAENVSTFSADVDTASYTYFRRLVNSGYDMQALINSGSNFRTEEFINYFKYDAKSPSDGELFGISSSITQCPWNEGSLLLRLTLQAETAEPSNGNNLVFLIDVSGSMSSQDKLPLLKRAFSYLVGNLSPRDRISIVTYSGREQVVLDGCAGGNTQRILSAINSLKASGSTNGEAGLSEAYRIAEKNRIEGGNNRIIMASDGDLNVGISSAEELKAYVEQKRDSGTYLSVLGFGMGNYRDSNMEALADNGNGVYYYIDGESEAEKIFGTDLLGTLYTVAEDVKLQLTFDKDYVSQYRLVGYENRLLNKEDFEDDTKDAGEVGASHQVTVCYELVMHDGVELAPAEASEWLGLAVRYKRPATTLSLLNEYSIGSDDYSKTDSDDIRFICCLIQTCMILHKSTYAEDITVADIIQELDSMDMSKHPERAEFCDLLRAATHGEKNK